MSPRLSLQSIAPDLPLCENLGTGHTKETGQVPGLDQMTAISKLPATLPGDKHWLLKDPKD